jgi:hypothetical protein
VIQTLFQINSDRFDNYKCNKPSSDAPHGMILKTGKTTEKGLDKLA